MGDWSVDITTPGSLENYLNDGDRYVQYKVIFETVNPDLSPVLEEVTIGWSELITSIDDEYNFAKPSAFQLLPNYPNPFNPTTTIKYQIPELSFVTIKVYDALGNEVITLVNEEKPIGNYEVEFSATGLPSGIYFYQLKTNNFTQTKKMILLK
jgi:hypothetical protein